MEEPFLPVGRITRCGEGYELGKREHCPSGSLGFPVSAEEGKLCGGWVWYASSMLLLGKMNSFEAFDTSTVPARKNVEQGEMKVN